MNKMKKTFQNLKTFFKNFKHFKDQFVKELNKLTAERLLAEYLQKNTAYLIKDYKYDEELFIKYIKICGEGELDKINSPIVNEDFIKKIKEKIKETK